jgi:hypothetical protein
VAFSLEHPRTSLLWSLPEFVELQRGQFVVDFDQCCYGMRKVASSGERAEQVWRRKRTRLLTNLPSLLSLAKKCRGEHAHEPLQGSVRTACGWRSRSELAAAYPRNLCRAWAAAVWKGVIVSRAEERWRRWIELYVTGDVELQPGPAAPLRPRLDRTRKRDTALLEDDVAAATSEVYTRKLIEFQQYLGLIGCGGLDRFAGSPLFGARVADFMQVRFADKTWGRNDAGTFVSAEGRHCTWLQSRGLLAAGWRESLVPARRCFHSWQRIEPSAPHVLVSWFVTLSLVVTFILSDNLSAAAVVALAFHCITRVDEACSCCWGDLRGVEAFDRSLLPRGRWRHGNSEAQC